jgi:hypothetical protein
MESLEQVPGPEIADPPADYRPPCQHSQDIPHEFLTIPMATDLPYEEELRTVNLTPFTNTPPPSPLKYWRLFMTDAALDMIVTNTNAYATLKLQGIAGNTRAWQPLSKYELQLWIGVVLFMALRNIQAPETCWSESSRIWQVADYMPLRRFEQIRRFVHIAVPVQVADSPSDEHWYEKVSPLANIIKRRFQTYAAMPSACSIDEMMVKFSGRSGHTIKMDRKPIKQGYKIFALCAHGGYTWDFSYWSRDEKNPTTVPRIRNFNPTANAVLNLASTLPARTQQCHIYMDNFFTSAKLFSKLREMGIGACGTARGNTPGLPTQLKALAATALGQSDQYCWNYLKSAGTRPASDTPGVHAFAWLDNAWVLGMTTIHGPCYDEEDFVERARRRPRKTSTNARIVRRIFGDEVRMWLPIPMIIDDYNFHMNAVDRADQLRGGLTSHRTGRRCWLPLFYWLLDVTKVNAYLLYKTHSLEAGNEPKHQLTHRAFHEQLAFGLIVDAFTKSRNHVTAHAAVSCTYTKPPAQPLNRSVIPLNRRQRKHSRVQLPASRLDQTVVHTRVRNPNSKKYCVWCRYTGNVAGKRVFGEIVNGSVLMTRQRERQTSFSCLYCKVAVCEGCFDEFHRV